MVEVEIAAQQKHRYVSKQLDATEIKMAQRLVHQVFVGEMKWMPEHDNPSGIQFTVDEAEPRFVDDFDCVATWFGTFDQETLVACWRFCSPKNEDFELERYHPIPTFLKTAKSLEVTRLAIHPDYRTKSRVLFDLVQQTYQQLYQHFDYVFAAVSFPDPGNLYLKIGLKKAAFSPFKYSPSDRQEVSLIYLDFADKTTLASGMVRGKANQTGTCSWSKPKKALELVKPKSASESIELEPTKF
jgi:hypothetical protein